MTERCDFCNGTGRICSDYYDRGHECPDCAGLGEWEDDEFEPEDRAVQFHASMSLIRERMARLG